MTIATIYSFAANEEDTTEGILDDEGFETELLDQSSREFLDFAIDVAFLANIGVPVNPNKW